MNVKASLLLTSRDRPKDRRPGALLSERYKIGHKVPRSLQTILVDIGVVLAEFWVNSGCGTIDEMHKELHAAGEELTNLIWGEV
jgi:hypothetical protein